MSVVQSFRETLPRTVGAALAVGGVAATIATHAAVLTGRLPHTAVSGGRITDPAEGRRVAVTSTCALLPVAVLVARGVGLAGGASRAERVALGALAMAGLGSVPVQALGTPYERRFMAPLAAALAVGLGRLSVEPS